VQRTEIFVEGYQSTNSAGAAHRNICRTVINQPIQQVQRTAIFVEQKSNLPGHQVQRTTIFVERLLINQFCKCSAPLIFVEPTSIDHHRFV
jgi:hypothetical protein